MQFYKINNSYSSQIEGNALINIRFGYTCFGVAYNNKHWKKRAKDFSVLPKLSLAFWNHTGQCNQMWVFRFNIGPLRIAYRTIGDARPELATFYDAGFYFRLFFIKLDPYNYRGRLA